jgi:hypothetical protein
MGAAFAIAAQSLAPPRTNALRAFALQPRRPDIMVPPRMAASPSVTAIE